MTSSRNVVRSLSADESSSSFDRNHGQLFAQDEAHHPSTRNPDQKQRSSLLKRLRRVLRLNAPNVRPPPQKKRDGHSSSNPSYPDSPDSFDNSNLGYKHSSRARMWRNALNARTANERARRDITLSTHGMPSSNDTGSRGPDLTSSDPTFSASEKSLHLPKTSREAGTSRSLHRSLPKRVFSSPPSLSARTFGFGSRKRNPSSPNPLHGRAATVSSGLGEGDFNRIKRLNRSLAARSSLYEGRGSMNLAAISSSVDVPASSPERSAAAFKEVCQAAIAGRVTFSFLLDAMYRLEERLMTDVKDMLIQYLSRHESMEALIDQLTVVHHSEVQDQIVDGPIGEDERYRYSYVSYTLLSTGPTQLRRSLFLNPKHLDRLVHVLGHNTPSDPAVVRSVCRVLFSVLRDSPEDTVRAMNKRDDFVDALLSHIAVTGCPEVCLSMLSTVICQAELKFGPCNKPVVGMMADANLMETLCDKLEAAARCDPLDSISSSTIENCSRVIVGIALRALVIPRYQVDVNDSSSVYMTNFNRDLASLDVFSEPKPILRLLDCGINAVLSYDKRGYALSTALTAVRYLLVTALKAQDSSLSAIRMQLMSVSTAAYEAGVRSKIPSLARILEHAREGAVVETMLEKVQNPLGVVRLKILELIIVLLQHGTEATAMAIADAEIPRILMSLFLRLKRNSLLQHFVSAIIELVFTSSFSHVRRAFFVDLNILESLMAIWYETTENIDGSEKGHLIYSGELMRIVCAIRDFLKVESREAAAYKQLIPQETFEKFFHFCSGPVAQKLKESGPLLCDSSDLRSRGSDDLSVDGCSSTGGSHGSLFIRARESSSAMKA